MKLRNKRTGGLANCEPIEVRTDAGFHDYYSLAELNEGWEDYEPKEPLIKDEKIRKAVRAWAEANDIERVWHEKASCWLRGNGLAIEMENEVFDLEQGNFSIAELCGTPEPIEPTFIDLDERVKEKEEE